MTLHQNSILKPLPSVPVVEARVFVDKKFAGRTTPLTMICTTKGDDQADVYVEYVVKFYADMDFGVCSLARELYAALLGSAFGFTIPPTAVVNIPSELADSLDGDVARKVGNSPGLNFGSKLIESPVILNSLPREHLQLGADIFAFDMLIQNIDRRKEKPNMFQSQSGLVLFDHELAFFCAKPEIVLGGLPEPWEFKTQNPTGHVLYDHLSGKAVQFDDFVAKLSAATDSLLADIEDRIPNEWHSPEIANIRRHLVKARDNAGKFKRALQETLV